MMNEYPSPFTALHCVCALVCSTAAFPTGTLDEGDAPPPPHCSPAALPPVTVKGAWGNVTEGLFLLISCVLVLYLRRAGIGDTSASHRGWGGGGRGQGSFQQLSTTGCVWVPYLPPLTDWAKIFLRAFGQSTIFSGFSSLGHKFSSAPSAPLKTQHHFWGGGPPPTPPTSHRRTHSSEGAPGRGSFL